VRLSVGGGSDAQVLIAGAGPAGAITGLLLARAGVRVRILDRARFPRHKLCGDTINPGALAILERRGLRDVTHGGLPVDGMVVGGERRVRVDARYGDGCQGIAIPRRVLDQRLLAAAAAAGASIEEGVLVERALVSPDGSTVEGLVIVSGRGEQELRAPVTIAADGAFSRVARSVGLAATPQAPRRWAIGGFFSGVTEVGGFGEMHVRADCYLGLAPVPDGSTNACLVTADRRMLARAPDVLAHRLCSDLALGPRFAAARLLAPPVTLGPLAVETSAAGVPGLLLAGDAAGFVDPMTGDGLRFAFRGAELAAAEAARALDEGWQGAHLRLHAARRREFAAKWRFNRALRALVAHPAAVRLASHAAALCPPLLRAAVRYAGDVRA
jgi:flavin-dependent dehydrogenase